MQIAAHEINLPYYLTSEQKAGLVKELNNFPHCNYFTEHAPEGTLQGDGWTKMDVFEFSSGSRKAVKGIVLSNSCDIEPGNSRPLPAKIVFAPLVPLAAYGELLARSGIDPAKISQRFTEIRGQKLTSFFFIPAGAKLSEDHIAILDDIHSIPVQHFLKRDEKAKLFTLSQVAFYLFVMKLSIHFCRMHEAVVR